MSSPMKVVEIGKYEFRNAVLSYNFVVLNDINYISISNLFQMGAIWFLNIKIFLIRKIFQYNLFSSWREQSKIS